MKNTKTTKTNTTNTEMFCLSCGKFVSVTENKDVGKIVCQCGSYVPIGKTVENRLADEATNRIRSKVGLMISQYTQNGYNAFRWMYNVCGTSKIYYADLDQLMTLLKREKDMREHVKLKGEMCFMDKIDFGMYDTVESMHGDFVAEYTESLYDYCVQNSENVKEFYLKFRECLFINSLFGSKK